MRKVVVSLFAAAVLLGGLAFVRAAADGEKQLQNARGSVGYALPSASPQPIAAQAAISLADSDTAMTGASSLGILTLPDSSRIMLGSETTVKLAFFNQTAAANADFIVYKGLVRFAVEHPQGAHANYSFTTPAATIGVRGTQGDIFSSAYLLRLNVYVLSDPTLPVQVTLADGRQFDVRQGQTLVADLTQSPIAVRVTPTTPSAVVAFTADFGPAPQPTAAPRRRNAFWRGVVQSVEQGLINAGMQKAAESVTQSKTPQSAATSAPGAQPNEQTTIPQPYPTK
jgi:hypothetical protein